MKKILTAFFLASFALTVTAQMPARTQANIEKYKKICRDQIYKDMKGMYREPGGSLKFPFLAPGSSQYLDMLWDWDSWHNRQLS